LSASKVKIEEIGARIFKEEMEETPEESPVCNPFLLEARQRKAALRQNHLKELFTTYSHVCEQKKNGSSLYGQLPTIVNRNVDIVVDQSNNPSCYLKYTDYLRSLIKTNEERAQEMQGNGK
jgi:hypothetical protein